MKKKCLNGKLLLHKETISNLNSITGGGGRGRTTDEGPATTTRDPQETPGYSDDRYCCTEKC